MKLSDTQLVILSSAGQRADRSVYPVETKITGGALQKVLSSLLAKRLVEEIPATREDTVWREDGDGQRFTLRATEAAVAALGLADAEGGSAVARTGPRARQAPAAAQAAKGRATKATGKVTVTRRKEARVGAPVAKGGAGTKQAQLIVMLRRKEGATIGDIVKKVGWQPHTVRGAFAGALKKRLGLELTSEKVEGRGRVYRIPV